MITQWKTSRVRFPKVRLQCVILILLGTLTVTLQGDWEKEG